MCDVLTMYKITPVKVGIVIILMIGPAVWLIAAISKLYRQDEEVRPVACSCFLGMVLGLVTGIPFRMRFAVGGVLFFRQPLTGMLQSFIG